MTTQEMTETQDGQEWAPAWAVDCGGGRWKVEWEVPGASQYKLYRLPDTPDTDQEPAAIAEGASLPDLAFTAIEELAAGQYVVAAYNGGVFPLAVSALGVGERGGKANITRHLRQWHSWTKLAPYKPNAKHKVGGEGVSQVKGVKRTKQSYTLTKNPDQAVTFNPTVNVCYPGAIVQARPAIDHGYLVPAQIEADDRADLAITVDRVTGRSAVASPPSASEVAKAIGKVVQEDSPGSADVAFRRREAYSSAEVALELGISATYGGFAASLDVEAKRQETKNTVLVYLRERGFTAFCDTSTPEALFKDSFTEEKLAQIITNGYMGQNNPPLLVSSVVYGRIMSFTCTSTSSESEIKAALQASYSGFGGDAKSNLAMRQKEILKNSDIAIVGLSVTPDMVKGLLVDGNLQKYFSTPQKFKSYGVIGYTLQTLDGNPAKMSETTSYDAVTWGEETSQVNLKVTSIGSSSGEYPKSLDLTIDGEKVPCTPDKPATKKRAFPEDGSGDPFHITKISGGGAFIPMNVDWKLSPKELGWFTGGQTTATGRYPKDGKLWANYTATKE